VGNASPVVAVPFFVNAYLWYVDEHEDVRHHLRAGSCDEARERIAATRGDEIAQRAVIKSLKGARAHSSECAAA
jgi:hypothetical protein